MSALQHIHFWMNSFYIWHKWSLTLEGVSHTVTLTFTDIFFSCDTYLYRFIHMRHKYNPRGDDVSRIISRSIGQRSRSQGSLEFLQSGRKVIDLQWQVQSYRRCSTSSINNKHCKAYNLCISMGTYHRRVIRRSMIGYLKINRWSSTISGYTYGR